MAKRESIEIGGLFQLQTDHMVALEISGHTDLVWFPFNTCELHGTGHARGVVVRVTVPKKLAIEKGLA